MPWSWSGWEHHQHHRGTGAARLWHADTPSQDQPQHPAKISFRLVRCVSITRWHSQIQPPVVSEITYLGLTLNLVLPILRAALEFVARDGRIWAGMVQSWRSGLLQWPQEITTLFCSDLKTQTTSLSNEFKCFNAQDHVTLAQSLSDHKSQQPPQGVLCIRSKEISIPEIGFYFDEILK